MSYHELPPSQSHSQRTLSSVAEINSALFRVTLRELKGMLDKIQDEITPHSSHSKINLMSYHELGAVVKGDVVQYKDFGKH
jgi:hypothetical protein